MLSDIVAITNRHLCKTDLLFQIEILCQAGVDKIVLREKDLSQSEYTALAQNVINITNNYNTELVLHSFFSVAEELSHKKIHLTMKDFRENISRIKEYEVVGVSTHSVEEAIGAEKLGATYITASHIYLTECKKGIEPRGIEYLSRVCESVNIPVFALGGINFTNMNEPLLAGAKKVCMMSELMTYSG